MDKLSVASTTYHEDKGKALLNFAELYRNGAIKTFAARNEDLF